MELRYNGTTLNSSGRKMYMRFNSDSSVSGSGFTIYYIAVASSHSASCSDSSSASSVAVGLIVGIIVGIIVLIVIAVLQSPTHSLPNPQPTACNRVKAMEVTGCNSNHSRCSLPNPRTTRLSSTHHPSSPPTSMVTRIILQAGRIRRTSNTLSSIMKMALTQRLI